MSGVAAPPATAVQLQFPHAAQGSSCFSVSTAAAGARLRPQTPGRGRPGMGLSRLGTSSSAGPPRLPASGVRPPPEVPTPRAPAPRAFPPAGPTSCATVAGRPGGEERKSVRARVAKFQLCAELRGNKREGGAEREQHVGGGGAERGSNTWEGAGPPRRGLCLLSPLHPGFSGRQGSTFPFQSPGEPISECPSLVGARTVRILLVNRFLFK